MSNPKNLVVRLLFVMAISLGVISCSNKSQLVESSGTRVKNPISHTHAANKCIDAVTHSHLNGDKKHLHYFHYCNTNAINPNAHTHPSSSTVMGYIRHTHPNGDKPHKHASGGAPVYP